MITRIEVDGFKSLRRFAMDLEPFTVLIGPNSAGKSNVIEAIALLSRLASKPIAEAFKEGRGKSIDQFSRHGAETARSIRFAVELLESGDYPPSSAEPLQSRFRYELVIERRAMRSGAEKLVVEDERLSAMRPEDDTWVKSHPELAGHACYANAGEDYFRTIHDERAAQQHRVSALSFPAREEKGILRAYTGLGSSSLGPARGSGQLSFVDTRLVEQNLERCRVFAPGVLHAGEPSERIDSGDLAPDASNLPTILAELPPNVVGGIRADLVSLVPGIASFDVTPAGEELALLFELSGGERMPARLMSAGTLRILALMAALRMEPRPFLLCVEEPENGIYPGRLRALLELLREETARSHEEDVRDAFEQARREYGAAGIRTNQLPTQILLTTHSPVVLAALRSHPEHLRFVDMVRRDRERVTRVRTVAGAGDGGRTTITLHEIDALLSAARSGEPA